MSWYLFMTETRERESAPHWGWGQLDSSSSLMFLPISVCRWNHHRSDRTHRQKRKEKESATFFIAIQQTMFGSYGSSHGIVCSYTPMFLSSNAISLEIIVFKVLVFIKEQPRNRSRLRFQILSLEIMEEQSRNRFKFVWNHWPHPQCQACALSLSPSLAVWGFVFYFFSTIIHQSLRSDHLLSPFFLTSLTIKEQ